MISGSHQAQRILRSLRRRRALTPTRHSRWPLDNEDNHPTLVCLRIKNCFIHRGGFGLKIGSLMICVRDCHLVALTGSAFLLVSYSNRPEGPAAPGRETPKKQPTVVM